MAIWQFDFYIVPKSNLALKNKINSQDILSWKNENHLSIQIGFLEEQTSWTKDIVQYGNINETCIQFLYEEGELEEINCRIDLRSLSKIQLEKIVEFIQEIRGVIFYEGSFYYPNIKEIVGLIKKSEVNKFCQNPRVYFDELSGEEL